LLAGGWPYVGYPVGGVGEPDCEDGPDCGDGADPEDAGKPPVDGPVLG